MTLSKLIRKGGLGQNATATAATFATQEAKSAATVANVATVAVATQPQPPGADISTDNTAMREWLSHIPNGLETEIRELRHEELRALVDALETTRTRERGEVPPHYTKQVTCAHCGPVWLWEGLPARVEGCPWCFNRLQHQPIPRPNLGEPCDE